jgi:succinyl-diaminopimelate desuccinylase
MTNREFLSNDDLHAFCDSHKDDLHRWLVDLIRARTVNPPGDEYLAAKVLTDFCDACGIPYETFEKEPGRTNVVARIGAGRPRIIVPCHFDVVPAGDGWETDPFEPVETGGRIVGRGATDNKGPLAAMMLAAAYLKQHETDLAGQLILVGCADEEAGSNLGMIYLLAECGLEAEYSIVPDAGHGMKLIDVGEKGALFTKVVAVGRQAHGSTPERGASALWPVLDFLGRLRDWRPPPPPESDAAALFTPATLNIGAVHAGTVANMVPGKCEALIDIRYLPGADGDAILAHLRSELAAVEAGADGVRMDLEVESHQLPSLVDTEGPLVAALERATERVTGNRPKRYGQSGATVAKFLILHGVPAIGFCCGPEGVAHVAGEWIELDDLARFAEVMTRTVLDLMGEAG